MPITIRPQPSIPLEGLPVDPKKMYPISIAARFLGVSTRQMRRWDAAGILCPEARSSAGHRRYSEEQLLKTRREWSKDPPLRRRPVKGRRREGVPLPFLKDEE